MVVWKRGGPNPSGSTGRRRVEAATRVDDKEIMMPGIRAAVSVEDIRRTYYDTLGSGQMWWWIREVRVNPAELIVDDDEGSLYRVSYAIDTANDTITFGEAQPVKIEYVDVAAGRPVVDVAAGQMVAAAWADPSTAARPHREGTNPRRRAAAADPAQPEPVSATVPNQPEEVDVKLSDEALQKLGLEPGASEDAINAAVLAMSDAPPSSDPPADEPAAPSTPPVADPPAPQTEPKPDDTDDDGNKPDESNVTKLPEGMVLIDTATLEELKTGVAAANTLMTERTKSERDALLDGAIRAGKFPRARRAHYEQLLAADPEGTKALIGNLASGVIPVTERGVAAADGETVEGEPNAYPESWKSSIRASSTRSSRVKVGND